MRDRADLRLNRWAKDFLDTEPTILYHEVVTRFYPNGSSRQAEPNPIYSTEESPDTTDDVRQGPLGDEIPMRCYRYKDGREYGEFVQAIIEYTDGRRVYALGLRQGTKWIIDSMWSLLELRALGGKILYKCTR